jgi:hypothetical protein
MSLFDRERERWQRRQQKEAEAAVKAAERVRKEEAKQLAKAQARASTWRLQETSQKFLDESPFPSLLALLAELAQYIGAQVDVMQTVRESKRIKQFEDPASKDFGGTGISLVKTNTTSTRTGHRHYKYSTQERWINVMALPDGTIKVEGNIFGRIVLERGQWRDPLTGMLQRDAAEKAISKAWKHPHRRTETGSSFLDI